MQEMPEAALRGDKDDTVTFVKIHQLVTRPLERGGDLLVYASLIGSPQSIKVLRGGCSIGLNIFIGGQPIAMPAAVEGIFRYDFAFHRMADEHVHCAVKTVHQAGIILMDDTSEEEWRDEILRVSSLPLLPEWTPTLAAKIKAKCKPVGLHTFNCTCTCYRLEDYDIQQILLAAIDSGEISIPDCQVDIGEVASISDYIRIYAERMIDSAGSAMEPLFNPRTEQPVIPVLLRRPFRPQAWVMEGAKRMMLSK